MPISDCVELISRLRAEPRETEWLEFKQNNFHAEETGKYVAALANSAMLCGEDKAYLVFGVDNVSHEAVGTSVRLRNEKMGEQSFEHWLSMMLEPRVNFEFAACDYNGIYIELIVIYPEYTAPVKFKGEKYIRIDSTQQLLKNHEGRERALWAITSKYSFEDGIAAPHLDEASILGRFDCEKLLSALSDRTRNATSIIERLSLEKLILDDRQGRFDIPNLLAIVAANDLSEFPLLQSKRPRVIIYSGPSKLAAVDDITGRRGYGITFERLLRYIMDRIPHKEEMAHGVRSVKYAIPEIAIRELLANALIHQDLTAGGEGPRVEVFPDKVRITNPGKPLISLDRFIDAPARSRNEKLAGLMRRMGLCEERGSGIDRAIAAIEKAALPPPMFQEVEGSTVVTVFGERSFANMTKDDRIRACFQHSQLLHEAGSHMSNASLRARFGLSDKQYPQVSIVIRDAIDAGKIKPLGEDQPNRLARYSPFYA